MSEPRCEQKGAFSVRDKHGQTAVHGLFSDELPPTMTGVSWFSGVSLVRWKTQPCCLPTPPISADDNSSPPRTPLNRTRHTHEKEASGHADHERHNDTAGCLCCTISMLPNFPSGPDMNAKPHFRDPPISETRSNWPRSKT